jgi:hypothetical protein
MMLEKDEEHLFWIIRLSNAVNSFLSIHAPPLNVNGEKLSPVALQYKKLKILICLQPDAQPTPDLLFSIPHIVSLLKRLFDRFSIQIVRGKISHPYLIFHNDKPTHNILLSHEKLADAVIPTILSALDRDDASMDFLLLFLQKIGRQFQEATRPAEQQQLVQFVGNIASK